MRFWIFMLGSVLLVLSLVDFFAMGSAMMSFAVDLGAFLMGAVCLLIGFHDSPTKYG